MVVVALLSAPVPPDNAGACFVLRSASLLAAALREIDEAAALPLQLVGCNAVLLTASLLAAALRRN